MKTFWNKLKYWQKWLVALIVATLTATLIFSRYIFVSIKYQDDITLCEAIDFEERFGSTWGLPYIHLNYIVNPSFVVKKKCASLEGLRKYFALD